MRAMLSAVFILASLLVASAEQCGRQASNALCPGGLCCSQFGWFGSTDPCCVTGCQSQCGDGSSPPPPSTVATPPPSTGDGSGVASIITASLFEQMLIHRNDAACPYRFEQIRNQDAEDLTTMPQLEIGDKIIMPPSALDCLDQDAQDEAEAEPRGPPPRSMEEDPSLPETVVQEIEDLLGYNFRNPSLLTEALTHGSYYSDGHLSYDRLEFIGDAVLGLAISRFPNRWTDSIDP